MNLNSLHHLRTWGAVGAVLAIAGAVLVAPGVAVPGPGRAVSWGSNAHGQLGDSTTTESGVPVVVGGLLASRTLTAISAGSAHTCAVADGKAYCWGWNAHGELGNGGTTDSSVPVAVDTSGPLSNKMVALISSGGENSCAVADGKAHCWGWNGFGQLGNGSTTDSSVPTTVLSDGALAGKSLTDISTGYAHSCAVADGRAYCWGWNLYGQLGNASNSNSSVPVAVGGALLGKTVTAVTASDYSSCAVADGRAYCWGYNGSGQLGNASLINSNTPVPVSTSGALGGKTVTAVEATKQHACAVADWWAYCWGFNGGGELGNGQVTNSSVPVAVDTNGVLAGRTVTAISTGYEHSCVVADGKAFCWGQNWAGQLGNASTIYSTVPVETSTSGALNNQKVIAIDSGAFFSVALHAAAPQPPTEVVGAPGDGQVKVSWTPPADDGGSPIEAYTATATPSGATCTTGATSCVVSGLANGTAYTFTLTARNAVGTSIASAPSAPVTPKPPAPAKVTGVKAKLHKGTVKITWKKAAGARSYRVRISKPGGTKYKAWKSTTKRVFKATVKKGKKYRFQVAAVNAAGRGPVTTIRFKGK